MVGTSDSVVIRQYGPADLTACRGLWVELTQWHRDIYRDLKIGGSDPGRLFDEHLERVGPENIWVAEVSGRVVGLAGLIPDKGEPELEPLVVSETHRRLGIGRRLVEAVIEKAREGGARFLRVRPTARNELALRVFHGLGFGILGHIELLMDFSEGTHATWRRGEELAGVEFKV